MAPKSPRQAPLRERLREQLRRFPRDKRERFLDRALAILGMDDIAPQPPTKGERLKHLKALGQASQEFLRAMHMHSEGLEEKDHRADVMRRMLAAFERAGGPRAFFQKYNADPNYRPPASPDPIPETSRLEEAWSEAIDAVKRLGKEIEEQIGSMPAPRTGPQRAGSDEILAQIAAVYLEQLGEVPVSTRCGTFYNLAVIITGQDSPERAVRAAVAGINKKRRIHRAS